MGVVAETISALAKDVSYRQAVAPSYLTGSFVVNDTDSHTWKIDGRGKGRLTVAVDNLGSDQVVTVSVYGSHSITAAVGGSGVMQIGSSFTVGTTSAGYETVNDPFPFYIVVIVAAGAATNSPTDTVWMDFSAF